MENAQVSAIVAKDDGPSEDEKIDETSSTSEKIEIDKDDLELSKSSWINKESLPNFHSCLSLGSESLFRKRILSADDFETIASFALGYHGLAVDCERAMLDHFSDDYEPLAVKSILRVVLGRRVESQFAVPAHRSKKYLDDYLMRASEDKDGTLLLRLAERNNMSPVLFCKLVLREKYRESVDGALNRYIADTDLIADEQLAANVKHCITNDIIVGPLAEVRCQIMRENYKLMLKQKADLCNLSFYEGRGHGTMPDIKMMVPFLYQDHLITWMESKPHFADRTMHTTNLKRQLQGFADRLGTGIVIYWLGFQEDLIDEQSYNGVLVLDHFPHEREIELLDSAMFLSDDEDDDESHEKGMGTDDFEDDGDQSMLTNTKGVNITFEGLSVSGLL